jgi:hypothetical protein
MRNKRRDGKVPAIQGEIPARLQLRFYRPVAFLANSAVFGTITSVTNAQVAQW